MSDLTNEELVRALAGGTIALTATRRLARALRLAVAGQSESASWQTPDAMPWPAWVLATYRELRDFGMLDPVKPCLDELQAAVVWSEVLESEPLAGQLLMPAGAVESFREAWSLAHDWQLPWPELGARGGEDCRAFLRAAESYRRRLQALGCLDACDLPAIVAGHIGKLDGRSLLFAGFDRLNPAQQSVFRASGVRALRVAPPGLRGEVSLAAFPDARHEFAAAAAWARARLESDPSARVAIIVPELGACAPLVEDCLDEALVPERLLPGRGDAPRPWNLSLGAPLADAPVVATALLALGLARDRLEPAEAGRLLRSPFTAGAAEEGASRARFDAWLREHARGGLTPTQWLGWLEGRQHAPACPRLARGLRGLLDELDATPRRRRPSAWAAAVTRALARLGWPGDVPLDSTTWQTVQAWAELLESFARLDAVTGTLAVAEALARLRRLAAERSFQPETPDLPVQVLGLLETAGLQFDGLWIAGMHDGVLPAPLRPCALLPAGLQREHGLPRSCPDTELALARQMVGRLAVAAPEVRFSYPQRREDEPLRPSPLIAHFPPPGSSFVSLPGVAVQVFESRRLEALEDPSGPPVSGEVSGGTRLLAAQSACPFQAFAVHRLAARPLETPAAGVDGRARGQFLHLALRELWADLLDRHGLAALDQPGRDGRLRAVLEQAARQVFAGVPPGLVDIEIEEAARRIGELLKLELLRPAFTVAALEAPVRLDVGALQLSGRIDRIDRVPGGLAIIDYKSGQASGADWDGARPREPQMPLYALAHAEKLEALVYASLKPGGVSLSGRARAPESFGEALHVRKTPTPEAWQAQLDGWRVVLEALAQAFGRGDARVDPLRVAGGNSPCGHCHLHVLCRRDELLRTGALADD